MDNILSIIRKNVKIYLRKYLCYTKYKIFYNRNTDETKSNILLNWRKWENMNKIFKIHKFILT